MELLQDSHIWYIFSFVIFAGIVIRFGLPLFNALLDSRIAQIKKELEEAENLRIEAQEMLAQYQRKKRDAVKESEKILKTAEENAEKFREKAEKDLDDIIKRKERQLTDRLERMKRNAINEIQAHAADMAVNATQQIIAEKLDKKTGAQLVDKAISGIDTHIH